jgi:hypothetical protein
MGPKSGPVKEPADQVVKAIRRATRRLQPARGCRAVRARTGNVRSADGWRVGPRAGNRPLL